MKGAIAAFAAAGAALAAAQGSTTEIDGQTYRCSPMYYGADVGKIYSIQEVNPGGAMTALGVECNRAQFVKYDVQERVVVATIDTENIPEDYKLIFRADADTPFHRKIKEEQGLPDPEYL